MCILCVVQKWSRRIVSMLPWLVIPLIGLWALSQLLPPGLRFEITSPRLACVLVLLGTLFWYEILLPQLSVYWARRSARIRERQRILAIELQKLRKTATRRCRNCLTPYRDQNPGGGKFMCSYCGHVSKRPVLDIPGPPGSSRIISNLVKKNSWFCGQDYAAEGNGKSMPSFPRYLVNGDKEQCLADQPYSGVAVFAWKLLSSVFSCMRWFSRKVLRLGSYSDDSSLDGEHKGFGRKCENGGNCQESKGEKAKRKAEEKRQARLEKEMLEEEERKQKEEIARLIEERRKLRDEKVEADKDRMKGVCLHGDDDNKRESEKRKQDKRREKDKGSSKKSSDGEDPEKRPNRETEKKHEYDKKGECERRDSCRTSMENRKAYMETVHSAKAAANKYKYLDRIKGTFLSSSRGLPGTTIFEKGSLSTTASATKSGKSIGTFVDYTQSSGNRREGHTVGQVIGKGSINGDSKATITAYSQTVTSDLQPQTTTLRKPWHQLFTRSSAVSPCPDANEVKTLNQSGHPGVGSSYLPDQDIQSHLLHNQLQFGQPLTFTSYPSMNSSIMANSVSPLFPDARFPISREVDHKFTKEEGEIFEDPCYVPDPVSLLGPVSESLDDFSRDSGAEFLADYKSDPQPSRILKNVSDSPETNKPSPIESPMSKLRTSGEKCVSSRPCTPKSRDQNTLEGGESSDIIDKGTWDMWGTSLDGRDLVGGSINWLSALGQNLGNHEEIRQPPMYGSLTSYAMNDSNVLQGTCAHPQTAHVGNQSGGMFSPFTSIIPKNDPWSQRAVFHSLPGDGENHFPSLNLHNGGPQTTKPHESQRILAANHPFDQYPAGCWSKGEWAVHEGKDADNSDAIGSQVGESLPSNPDVQSGPPTDGGGGQGDGNMGGSIHTVAGGKTAPSWEGFGTGYDV